MAPDRRCQQYFATPRSDTRHGARAAACADVTQRKAMAEQPIPIYNDYDFYVPAFELKVKGQRLNRDVIRDVISVSYSDSLDKLDSCTITLNNWDAERRDFKYSDPRTTP